ncbi:Uncharacterized protein TPAR_03971 [Tolypocladium paradoxum]|uniref:Uncharacterized protein n=1 Tax=Tolypocladium paradoxum TaxID=94208 RepID=A0A2S4L076_9HYPO|nr:Uncharacterized protein TPAR_03971 [Tolypocladium paradoxum]
MSNEYRDTAVLHLVVALTCFVVAFASAVVTANSEEVALLSFSLFVVGFGVRPIVFTPLLEIYGRRVIYGSTLLISVVFVIPCAAAKNIQTLLACRAIDGIAFSAPMTLARGTLADLWRNEERGVPMAAFSAGPFIGRASEIQLNFSDVVWILITFTVPETDTPTILARQAKKLRTSTGDSSHVTEQELDLRPLSERFAIFPIRPFQLLFGELIVFLISAYMSVLYGLLYMFFVGFPIIYPKGQALPQPSLQLKGPMVASCWFIPIGLFIFAWTSYLEISWAGPATGGFPAGFGFIFPYNSANNYLVDSYQHQAASALAAKTFIRSFWGAAVVLFTEQMYDCMGDQWGSTLLAFINLACCAIPFCSGSLGRGFGHGASMRRRARTSSARVRARMMWRRRTRKVGRRAAET